MVEIDKSSHLELPQINKKTRTFQDEEGNFWVGADLLAQRYGTSWVTVRRRLRWLPSIEGRNTTGHSMTLYREELTINALQGFAALPRLKVDQSSIEAAGQEWSSVKSLTSEYTDKIKRTTLRKLLKTLQCIPAINYRGPRVRLYQRSAVEQIVDQYLNKPTISSDKRDEASQAIQETPSVPTVDKGTGRFIDSDQQQWAAAEFFYQQYGRLNRIKTSLQQVRGIVGIDRGGRTTVLYNEAKLLKLVGDELKKAQEKKSNGLPRLDKKTQIWTDPQGNSWVTAKYLFRKFGVSINTVRKLAKSLPRTQGLDITDQERCLYIESQVAAAVREFLALPVVDRQTQRYADKGGVSWVAINYFRKRGNLNSKITRHLANNVPTIKGRWASGQIGLLYREDRATHILNSLKGVISPNEANEQLRRLLE